MRGTHAARGSFCKRDVRATETLTVNGRDSELRNGMGASDQQMETMKLTILKMTESKDIEAYLASDFALLPVRMMVAHDDGTDWWVLRFVLNLRLERLGKPMQQFPAVHTEDVINSL